MPSHRASLRSSRRVPPLADKDIDHEISLVDHDEPVTSPITKRLSVRTSYSSQLSQIASPSTPNQPLARSDSRAPLAQNASEQGKLSNNGELDPGPSQTPRISEHPEQDEVESLSPEGSSGADQNTSLQEPPTRLSIDKKEPRGHQHPTNEIESEIDVLYENQRGGFLCGIPLFSLRHWGTWTPQPGPILPTSPAPLIYTQLRCLIRAGNGLGLSGV
ncbi:hypothetical protein RRF57_007955 [Xylaria bambusicola]|uniref:Uncharacterized protein n=1 Tax=Xylaria bambusicola TaxID=326684 RepID=A0AAN7ZAQ6_9PEZI